MKKMMLALILLSALLSGCADGAAQMPPKPSPLPRGTEAGPDTPVTSETSAPRPQPPVSEEGMIKEKAFVDSAEVLVMESDPPQIRVLVNGNAPTPCHFPKMVINPPDSRGRIEVEVYTLVNPDMICTQVLAPFVLNETVDMQDQASGKYSVIVNGKAIGEFDWP